MRVSPSRISASARGKSPAAHQIDGRLPIATFMEMAPIALSAAGALCFVGLDALVRGISDGIENGINEAFSNIAKGGK